jgi:hypothetical protein
MDSSTSPSNARCPILAVALLLTALTAWLVCVIYTFKISPDVSSHVQEAVIKARWADKMTREFGAKTVVYGGSSCTFSIDGERLLNRFHLPVVNYGFGADLGSMVLTESVMSHVCPGDTLIVALEPGLLTCPLDPPAMGIKFAFAEYHPEWVIHPVFSVPAQGWFHSLAALRPGSYNAFTFLGKIASRQPLMRYSKDDYNPSGYAHTPVRLKITGPPGHGPCLSADARVLLQNLRDWCRQRQVRIAYSLPWGYTPLAQKSTFQKSNLELLLQINEFIPVLKDPQLGADTELDHFADTAWHLTETSSPLRTDGFGLQIKNWDLWTDAELRRLASQL